MVGFIHVSRNIRKMARPTQVLHNSAAFDPEVFDSAVYHSSDEGQPPTCRLTRVSSGFYPQIMDSVLLPQTTLLPAATPNKKVAAQAEKERASTVIILATRRLKYHCATSEGKPCPQDGKPHTYMPYDEARKKAWVYYLESAPADGSGGPTRQWPRDTVLPKKRKWSSAVTRLPVGDKTDLEERPILFEAECTDSTNKYFPEVQHHI